MVNTSKIQALVAALTNKFEEKANKVTSWSSTTSDTNYPSEKLVKNSLDSIDSAKQDVSDKVTSFASSTTDVQYPSAKLVQDNLILKEDAANKVTSLSASSTDTQYPSAKCVYDELDLKLESSDLPTKTSDLTNDGDGENPFLTEHQSLDSTVVTLEKQGTADTGYASTYVLSQGGVAISPKINIPKDQLLQSASLETVGAEPSILETSHSLTTGDKYIKMVVNTENSETGATTLVIPVNELVDTYTADGTTIILSNGQFSIKAGGVGTTQLADSAVTTAKIDSSAVTTAKINDGAVTTAKIDNGAVTQAKLDSTFVSSLLTVSDVDSEIDSYIDALTTALTPVSGE